VPGRHGEHHLQALPCGDTPERVVDQVEVSGLLLPTLGEYGREGPGGSVHRYPPFNPGELGPGFGAGTSDDAAALGRG
jgi:hypothetical protein